MASFVVLKVNYGDTLRRFNALKCGDKLLDLDMQRLKLKICTLFNFLPEADLALTYIDEDQDVVTLVEDEDLLDVIRQGLNPVRINVKLNGDNKDKQAPSYASGSSTPHSSPLPQNLLLNEESGIADLLKVVPEPLREPLLKLSLEFASKAATTSPGVVNFASGFSKMGQSFINALSQDRSGTTDLSSQSKDSETPIYTFTGKNNEASRNEEVEGDALASSSSAPLVSSNSKKLDIKDTVGGVEECKQKLPDECIMHKIKSPKCDERCKGKNIMGEPMGLEKQQVESGCRSDNSCMGVNPVNGAAAPPSSPKPRVLRPHVLKRWPFTGFPTSPFLGEAFPSFRGVCTPFSPSSDAIFHVGVQCDGCGALPITGPRFKSKWQADYDLCNICFSQIGNDADYIRIDFASPRQSPWSFSRRASSLPRKQVHISGPGRRSDVMRPSRERLSGRFIMDVNVIDGTVMAPSTPFTKIWRMQNSGTVSWPRGIKLVWIGGDRFSPLDSVEIELPANGVDMDNELDIAVDFVAPELPGEYKSYWRMAHPHGYQFGQRLWVSIQVDASLNLAWDRAPMINLNLPPGGVGVPEHEAEDVKEKSDATGEQKKPQVDENRRDFELEDLNFPINNDLLVTSNAPSAISTTPLSSVPPLHVSLHPFPSPSSPSYANSLSHLNVGVSPSTQVPTSSAFASALYPIIDMSEESTATSPVVDLNGPPKESKGKNDVEGTLLKELEKMGFKEIDLNKEVLRMNEYDFVKSVDDLCDVCEWDPILEELQEMGFQDKERNMKLLVKNNGSITRVVMDLIAGEKTEA